MAEPELSGPAAVLMPKLVGQEVFRNRKIPSRLVYVPGLSCAKRPARTLEFHLKLPAGGRNKMTDVLLRNGLMVKTQGDFRLGDGALLIEESATDLMLYHPGPDRHRFPRPES